jgi:hypothetical protein
MLHDYHFYLAPMLRERCPQAVLQHFIHIPCRRPGMGEPATGHGDFDLPRGPGQR